MMRKHLVKDSVPQVVTCVDLPLWDSRLPPLSTAGAQWP
jgi:hypothetical protein